MTPMLGIMASQISGHLVTGAFDSIATVTVGSGGSSTITFTSIPGTYTHLQVRGIVRSSNASSAVGLRSQMGHGSLDTAANYSSHNLYGDGATPTAASAPGVNYMLAGSSPAASLTAGIFGVTILDILDYANGNKYKTVRDIGGFDANGSGYAEMDSGVWMSLSTVDTISLFFTAGNFVQYSQLALYGIKG